MGAAAAHDRVRQWAVWKQLAIDDINSILKTGSPVCSHKNNIAVRAIHKAVVFPLCCSLCIVWSAAVRIICCPFTFGSSIGGHALANNTDYCMLTYCEMVDKKIPPKTLVPFDMTWVARDQNMRSELMAFVDIFCEKMSISSVKFSMIDWLALQLGALGFKGFDFTRLVPANVKASITTLVYARSEVSINHRTS
jgi:hypothetical protein